VARHVHEFTGEYRVRIDGLTIEGWVAQASCMKCHGALVHYVVFDALFCPTCNDWAAVLCDDPACVYCRVRPSRPLDEAA
jgi:hypothetical protein